MIKLVGFIFSVLFGTLFGTTKFAVRNAVRAAAFGLVGYFVYELIIGYNQGKASAAPAPAAPAVPPPAPRPSLSAAPAPTQNTPARSPLVGGSDHVGRSVSVDDGGSHRTTQVGRGVIHR